jgi:hypothetical protein
MLAGHAARGGSPPRFIVFFNWNFPNPPPFEPGSVGAGVRAPAGQLLPGSLNQLTKMLFKRRNKLSKMLRCLHNL